MKRLSNKLKKVEYCTSKPWITNSQKKIPPPSAKTEKEKKKLFQGYLFHALCNYKSCTKQGPPQQVP